MEQRSEEWYKIRLGKVTASRVSDIVTKTKNGYSAARGTYLTELITERLTGKKIEKWVSRPMQWGTDNEDAARAAYEIQTGRMVNEIAFVPHPDIDMSGCSPDGLIGGYGLIEIKCPDTINHIEILMSESIPEKWMIQMQWQMACTARQWCDFVTFDPRLPPELSLAIIPVDRDETMIAKLENEVKIFLRELDDKINRLNNFIKEKKNGL